MNRLVLLVTLLVLAAALQAAESRSILGSTSSISDISDELGNSIELDQQIDPFEMHNWVKFTKTPPSEIVQTIGIPVEIECEIMGSQIPTIRWIVGNRPVIEMDANDLSEGSLTSIVRVRSVHIVDHIISKPKTYTCAGRSGETYIYASTIVYPPEDLKELPHFNHRLFSGPRMPRIVYSERLHLDLVGSDIVLPCRVAARPHAEISWINGHGKTIHQNHRHQILPSGDLAISGLKWEDMGVYKCIAQNSLGKDTTETFVYPALKEDRK